jgi:hypothetical protein
MTTEQEGPTTEQGEPRVPAKTMATANELMHGLTDHVKKLTEVVQLDGLDRRRQMRWVIVLGLALLMLLMLNVTVLFQNRARSLQNSQIIRNSASTSQQIADCTSPGGTCFERSQRKTAEIMRRLLVTDLYIAQCAKVTNTDSELEQCVAQRLSDADLSPNIGSAPVPEPTPEPVPEPTPSAAQDDAVTP